MQQLAECEAGEIARLCPEIASNEYCRQAWMRKTTQSQLLCAMSAYPTRGLTECVDFRPKADPPYKIAAKCQQLYTPAAQRRVVRRATPATLTGVSGRPTTAWAGVTRLNASVPVISFAASEAPMPMTVAPARNASFRERVIGLLQSCRF